MTATAIASELVSRRTLLKGLGAAGATVAVSACVPSAPSASAPAAGAAPAGGGAVAVGAGPTARVTAGGFSVATGVPMKQHTAADGYQAAAKLPKDALLEMYRKMQTSRMWESAMRDAFVGGQEGLYGYRRGSHGGRRHFGASAG